jgi:plasmid stabilization system protein ParE
MRERFYREPRIWQSKNTALDIVTRNRAHFSRELGAYRSRSGPTYRAILPVLWRHPYLVPYRVRGELIEVLRVLHGRQRWPDAL